MLQRMSLTIGVLILCRYSPASAQGDPIQAIIPNATLVAIITPSSTNTPIQTSPSATPIMNEPVNELQDIRNQFVGGLTAIRDSAGRIIGWTADKIGEGVQNVIIQPAIAVKEGIQETFIAPVIGAVAAVEEGARAVVRPVVQAGQAVVDKTVNTARQVGQAGGQIVSAWGDAARRTGNVTRELVNEIG